MRRIQIEGKERQKIANKKDLDSYKEEKDRK